MNFNYDDKNAYFQHFQLGQMIRQGNLRWHGTPASSNSGTKLCKSEKRTLAHICEDITKLGDISEFEKCDLIFDWITKASPEQDDVNIVS